MEKNHKVITEEMILADFAATLEGSVPGPEDSGDGSGEYASRQYVPEDYFTEDDIARENGCWVDEDGHWQPLPEDDWDW